MKIAYITYNGLVRYTPANNFDENKDLLPYLQDKGLDITSEIWDDPAVDWTRYDIALLKTPWDYHRKFPAFLAWLDKIRSLGVKLLNDYDIVHWNMDKHYLLGVADAGFDIIPSVFLDQGWNGELVPLFDKLGSDELIIKPCVSGGSKNTIIFNKKSVAEDRPAIVELVAEGDYIVQPLMPQIQEGEWSFIFFNGQYSHTIIKKPKAGDFRVQQVYGGTIEPVSPEPKDIEVAAGFVSRFAKDTLYARVDGLMVQGRFMLMELELVEPFLYLSYGEGAVERYCKAIKARV